MPFLIFLNNITHIKYNLKLLDIGKYLKEFQIHVLGIFICIFNKYAETALNIYFDYTQVLNLILITIRYIKSKFI